jgi:hypothetical protein
MRCVRFTILQKVGIPALIKTNNHIAAGDNFSLSSPLNFREHGFLNGWPFFFVSRIDSFAFTEVKSWT